MSIEFLFKVQYLKLFLHCTVSEEAIMTANSKSNPQAVYLSRFRLVVLSTDIRISIFRDTKESINTASSCMRLKKGRQEAPEPQNFPVGNCLWV